MLQQLQSWIWQPAVGRALGLRGVPSPAFEMSEGGLGGPPQVEDLPHQSLTMLLQFALLLFALFGLAALCIDMGMVTLTRVQMQTAADSAALEGLRYRDDPAGRAKAHDMAAFTFDNDFNPGNGDDLHLGAGPALAIEDPLVSGSATMNENRFTFDPPWTGFQTGPGGDHYLPPLPDQRVYKPDLQTNAADAAEGDMVAGQYSIAPRCADQTGPHGECADYQRNDFVNTGNSAFLVRLRRTRPVANSLDETPGVSSRGGAIPLVFGHGTLIGAKAGAPGDCQGSSVDTPCGGLEYRQYGVNVRATAIAALRPVLRVGVRVPKDPLVPASIPGVAPFLLRLEALQFCSGLIVQPGGTIDPDPTACFMPIKSPAGMYYDTASIFPTHLGVTLPTMAAAPPGNCDTIYYVPVYTDVLGTDRVVGFAAVQLSRCGESGPVTISPSPSSLANQNASTTRGPLPPLTPAETQAILAANDRLKMLAIYQLFAPALVR